MSTRQEQLDPIRLHRAKKAYTTRFVGALFAADPRGYALRSGDGVVPSAGDVVLARVVEIGRHKRLESPVSRRQTLFVGDEILLAYGHRYAPDQFEAEVPGDLSEAHLVAAGGLVGQVTAQHMLIDQPTVVQPLGLLVDGGGVVTLQRVAPKRIRTELPDPIPARFPPNRPTVIAVLGTSMNSGKSTTLACLVRGLTYAGLQVSAGKATGTGAGGDPRLFTDAGAHRVLDFTDFGFPSTFRLDYDRVRSLLVSLIDELATPGTDVVVVEIADGVYQTETGQLLRDPLFHAAVDRVVFSAFDALGAVAGVSVLEAAGVDVAAVSGVLTSSPLAAREATAALDVTVFETADLSDPDIARTVLP
ncbi:MAG: hypothetical protein ACR2KL_12640 [Nocardioidaceae bacterium]